MSHPDFDIFQQESIPLFKPTDKIDVAASAPQFSDTFISSFPRLHQLLAQASVLDITVTRKKNNLQYKLFTWTNAQGMKSGWLCEVDTAGKEIELLPAHTLLLENMGGIQSSYTQIGIEGPMLTDNQNFIFTKSQCRRGIGDWSDVYEQSCELEEAKPIDTGNLLCFAGEANGNETFYDLTSKQVLLFAPDHDFDNVEVLEGQPEYTFYTINDAPHFVDYVELLAQQWIALLAD